jgi:hypothetical protein
VGGQVLFGTGSREGNILQDAASDKGIGYFGPACQELIQRTDLSDQPSKATGTSTRTKGDEGVVDHIPNTNIFHSGGGYEPSPHRVHHGVPIVDIEARDHQ